MSYDIYLNDPVTGETIQFDSPHQMRGGNYAVGGTTEAWLNVTYNYASWYYIDGVFPSFPDEESPDDRSGIYSIYGMSGAESIPVIKHAIQTLEAMTETFPPNYKPEKGELENPSYWSPTRQNAIKPLYMLLAMAKMRPDGVWNVD